MDASALPGHPAYVRRPRAALRLASDKRLVALVRAGEAVAFEVLYDRHARKLLSFCRHMLGSQQDGEDALQRTFASAYRALQLDEREIELRPWLFAIARNECLTILRQRRPTSELDDTEPATEGLSSRVEGREDLRNMLADLRALPEHQRAALLLSELGGFTHAQIAEAVGARPEQIKAYVFQARTHLIAERDARERSCVEVRAQLANTRGAALLRRELSRHLRRCGDCRDYSAALKRQRRALAIVLPVAPSLALRSAALRSALGSAHGAGAGTGGSTGIAEAGLAKAGLAKAGLAQAGVAKAGLTEAGLAQAGQALTNSGGDALLTKGLALIALAGVTAGAGTLALHGSSSHHPLTSSHRPPAEAPPLAKAGSSDRILVSAPHPVAPLGPQGTRTPFAGLQHRVDLPPARSDAPPPGTSGRVAGSGTRASTPTRTTPVRHMAPAGNNQDVGAGARRQPARAPVSAGAPQTEPGGSSSGRGAERDAVNRDAAKEHSGGRGGTNSASPPTGHVTHGFNVSSQTPAAARSAALAESGDSTPPGHAYGQEPTRSTPAGHEIGAGSGASEAPGNSASAPGHIR